MSSKRQRASEVSRLATTSRGHPGLLVYLLNRALAGGTAPAVSGQSGDLSTLLRERISGLVHSQWSLLLHLALLDRPTSETFLRGLTNLSPSAFQSTRKSLEREGLVTRSQKRLFLDQHLLVEMVREAADEKTLRRAYGCIGRRLRSERGRRREAAHHLLRGGLVTQGLKAAEQAGRELHEAGRVEEALSVYTEALRHAVDPSVRQRLLEEQGDLQQKCGQFDDAGRSYDLLLESDELEAVDRVRVLRKRGGVEQRSGQTEAARETFERALSLLEQAENLDEHLHILNELASLCLFRGEFPRWTTFANRGIELLRTAKVSELSPESTALHALNFHSVAGHILLCQFEYNRAIEEFTRGLKLSERIGTLANTALILNNLGIAYHQTNRLSEAHGVYRQATTLARRMGDETALFSIQCNLAIIQKLSHAQLKAGERLVVRNDVNRLA